MTTTISLPTRDCIIIGCDSLATSSRNMIDPFRLWQAFFDDDGKLRLDESGSPSINAQQLYAYTERVSVNQLPNVTKIFPLKPFRAGLLFAGIAGVGDKSVRWLVETFLSQQPLDPSGTPVNRSLSDLGQALLDFLEAEFEEAFKETERSYWPDMEIILSGYSDNSRVPEIYKLNIGRNKTIENQSIEGRYEIVFGGQYDVIQRVVKGLDVQGFVAISDRHEDLMNKYHEDVQKWLIDNGSDLEIPSPDFNSDKYPLFANDFGGIRGILSDNGSLSEQAGINFVEFLIATMINAQDFSDRIPTVGGQIHVAIITPANGFKWISKEEFKFQNHSVPRYD